MTLAPDANALLHQLHDEREPRLREGGDLRPIASWLARYPGRAIRVAALIHLAADHAGNEISADTLRAGLAVGEWSLAHALDVLTGPDLDMRRALTWLRQTALPQVTLRDLQRGAFAGGKTGTSQDAHALAERLEAHGALHALDARTCEATRRTPPEPSLPRAPRPDRRRPLPR